MGDVVFGLDSAKLTSQSKHHSDSSKCVSAYNTEFDEQLQRAFSGNRYDGLYIVPRSTDIAPEDIIPPDQQREIFFTLIHE